MNSIACTRTMPDDVVRLVHAERQGFPVEGFLAHMGVYQAFQLFVRQGIEVRRGSLG